MARISRSAAKKLFETGYPVRGVRSKDDYSAWGWQSTAYSPQWLTFTELEQRETHSDGVAPEWETPEPSHRTQVEAAGHVFRREEFEIRNLSGTHFFLADETLGDLPEEYHASFGQAEYAVWSYQTPIAWTLPDRSVVIPSAAYSLTTTQHQYLVARALRGELPPNRESARRGKGRTPYTHRGGW